MDMTTVVRRLAQIKLPQAKFIAVIDAITGEETQPVRQRRRRRTKAQMAAAAKATPRKRRRRKVAAKAKTAE